MAHWRCGSVSRGRVTRSSGRERSLLVWGITQIWDTTEEETISAYWVESGLELTHFKFNKAKEDWEGGDLYAGGPGGPAIEVYSPPAHWFAMNYPRQRGKVGSGSRNPFSQFIIRLRRRNY